MLDRYRAMEHKHEQRTIFPVELRIVIAVVLAAFLGSTFGGPRADTARPESYTSNTALKLAHELEAAANELDYSDPALAATEGFLAPDASISAGKVLDRSGRPAEVGYTRTWQIVDDQPVRDMKTIEIRVEWPRDTTPGSLSIISVKAS